MKKSHLERACRWVAEGKHLIDNHEQMIARLRRSGSETLVRKAEGFLSELLQYQTRFEQHLSSLEVRLGIKPGSP